MTKREMRRIGEGLLTTLLLQFAVVALVLVAACSKESVSAPSSKPGELRLFDRNHAAISILSADGRLLDGTGHQVGRFDSVAGAVVLEDVTLSLAEVIHESAPGHCTLHVPGMAAYRVVLNNADLLIDDKLFGTLEGAQQTPQDWRRVTALVASLFWMPKPVVDAGVPPDAVERPIPPLPPLRPEPSAHP